jgi:hypothetical protein
MPVGDVEAIRSIAVLAKRTHSAGVAPGGHSSQRGGGTLGIQPSSSRGESQDVRVEVQIDVVVVCDLEAGDR